MHARERRRQLRVQFNINAKRTSSPLRTLMSRVQQKWDRNSVESADVPSSSLRRAESCGFVNGPDNQGIATTSESNLCKMMNKTLPSYEVVQLIQGGSLID